MKRFFILSALVFSSVVIASPSHHQSLRDNAHRYINSLGIDYRLQRSFYTPQTHFEDITSESFGQRWSYTGGQQIIDFWQRSFAAYGTLSVVPEIHDTIVQPPFVIITYTAHVTACGITTGHPNKVFTNPIKLVTALQFEGDKIIHHTDYGAYDDANTHLAGIASQLAEQPGDPRCAVYQ